MTQPLGVADGAEVAEVAAPSEPDERPARSRRLAGPLALALVVAVVGGLWLATAAKDLPYIHHSDEPVNMRVVDRMIEDGDPNPEYFTYPSLFFYLQAAVHLEGPLAGWIGADDAPPETQVIGTAKATTPGGVIVHRAVSVAAGIATVVAVYAATRLLTGRVGAALVAAGLMGTSVTLGVNARLVTPDIIATAFVAGTLWAGVRLWLRPTWGAHVLAGAMAGLAASSKYNAALAAVTVAVAAALARGLRDDARARVAKLAVSALAAGLAFLATTPYALLDRTAFLDHMLYQREHYASGHPGMDGDAALWYGRYLATTETLLVVGAALAVVAAVAWARWRPVALVTAFPLVYGAFIGSQAVRNDRTVLVLLPHVAVLAGLGAAVAAERVADRRARLRPPPRALAAAVLLAGLAVVTAQGARLVDELNPPTTTWAESRRWIERNVPKGSTVLIEGYSPWVDPDDYEVGSPILASHVPDVLAGDWSYVVVSEGIHARFVDDPDRFPEEARFYAALFERTTTVATFEGDGPTISVLRPRT